jgi:hypothetical protein
VSVVTLATHETATAILVAESDPTVPTLTRTAESEVHSVAGFVVKALLAAGEYVADTPPALAAAPSTVTETAPVAATLPITVEDGMTKSTVKT